MNRKYVIMGAAAVLVAGSLLFFIRPKHAAPVRPAAPAVVASARAEDFAKQIQQALALADQGELLKARDALKGLIATAASRPGIEDVQKKLDDINMRIMISGIQVPDQTATREVKEGDTLSMIADEYRTTVEFIKKENGLSSDVIRPGQRLRIWTGRLSVTVDKSQNVLMLQSNGEVMKTFRVSTGKDNITPVGTFKIVNKLKDPTWSHDGKVIPFGSPENILGTRWMGFNLPSYGIHGTSEPASIGTQATAGCVRMLNSEVEELYDLLPVNTEVTITD